ncbi:NADH-ubiquinone oxidoreductase 78 kDa subunit, mitochondrial [Smittium mucronatum]|uniref:NADH-ubiquinone oxidoreductase 78 kDa subunit, mitochondrial n=1 Tax=Smittium mucronatum TaxID=133383 RepID=A0A1R0H1P5_9FUNG|nr:NADH-ubiquinone oxidoreductase 78 kDa subunit, mitochondrial [Smittium mucronatum]OLY83060.1 NADH-ubiquinone oxidoreductase 78 kDa subunit, mitochondrial [Smittium mucronatum]
MLSRFSKVAALNKRLLGKPLNGGFAKSFSTSPLFKKEIELFVDGKSVHIEEGSAIIQAAEKVGVDIPRFCYHERLGVAGNCRMCLVEIEKSPKLAASCAMPVSPGMRVITTSERIKSSREAVMEFLLSSHPLDCPICDQAGECDLQEQSMRYGGDRSRYLEPKRAVEDKNIGPFVKTVMNRCIQCTRCVRFANEVAGAPEFGTTGRGNDLQIGTYISSALRTEMSGNIIDLCPVGALTSKPYAFKARPWELKKTESIDVMDAIGSNIRVDSRGNEVMRILPITNDEVNEEWINDKTRFSYDGLKNQRLVNPLIKVNDRFVAATWSEALQLIATKFQNTSPNGISAIAGNMADSESLVALKDLFNAAGCENLKVDSTNNSSAPAFDIDIRSNYLLNTTLVGTEHADALLIIGSDPRHEASILNIRIRKAYLYNNLNVGLIGNPSDLTYKYSHIGTDPSAIDSLLNGSHPFSKVLAEAKRPMILVGSAVSELSNADQTISKISKLALNIPNLITEEWNGFNVLQNYASRTAAYDIGFTPNVNSNAAASEFVYLLGADELEGDSSINSDTFVVYQGHHGDKGAHLANVILPGAAFTEKASTFVNAEGRSQVTRAAINPPGSSREDWQIIRALSEFIGMTLPYNNISELRSRMNDVSPTLNSYDDSLTSVSAEFAKLGLKNLSSKTGDSKSKPASEFVYPIKNFYMTDPISRSSSTMAKATADFA